MKPYLVIVYPPPEEWKGHRVEFLKQLMEKLNLVTKTVPVPVKRDMDFVCLLVEGNFGAIDGALHHACDNQTQYLLVQIEPPVAHSGLATAATWIRNHQP